MSTDKSADWFVVLFFIHIYKRWITILIAVFGSPARSKKMFGDKILLLDWSGIISLLPKMDYLNLSALFNMDGKLSIHEKILKNISLLMINSSHLQVDILDVSPEESIALTALYIPIFFIGFLGNITIVLIIGISPPLRNSTNWYLFNLAISDLCGRSY